MSTDRSPSLSSALSLLLPGAVLALSPLELGMAVRLAIAHEAGHLPAALDAQAQIALGHDAHADCARWLSVRARIQPFTTFLQPADAAPPAAPTLTAQRAAAGRKGAAARWSRTTPEQPPVPSTLPSGLPSSLPSSAIPAPPEPLVPSSLPSADVNTCAAQRFASFKNSAAQSQPTKAVSAIPAWVSSLAPLQAAPVLATTAQPARASLPSASPTLTPAPAARSRVPAAVGAWRAAQARTLLEQAISTWRAQGRSLRDDRQLQEDINAIVTAPGMHPAKVEIAIQRASRPDRSGNVIRQPMAFVLKTLLPKGDACFQPTLHDQATLERWATLERTALTTPTTPTPALMLTGGAA